MTEPDTGQEICVECKGNGNFPHEPIANKPYASLPIQGRVTGTKPFANPEGQSTRPALRSAFGKGVVVALRAGFAASGY